MTMYDPQLCYILDGFLGLYGLIITGMFIKEKVWRPIVFLFTLTYFTVAVAQHAAATVWELSSEDFKSDFCL